MKTRTTSEKTWKKLHAAYVAPTVPAIDYETLSAHARRFKVPLQEAEFRARCEEWEIERHALEAREFFDSTAPGCRTEIEYCLDYAGKMTSILGKDDLGSIGGEQLLNDQIADARVIWRKRMSNILVWEAIQASRKYLKRTATEPARQRASVRHGRAEKVA